MIALGPRSTASPPPLPKYLQLYTTSFLQKAPDPLSLPRLSFFRKLPQKLYQVSIPFSTIVFYLSSTKLLSSNQAFLYFSILCNRYHSADDDDPKSAGVPVEKFDPTLLPLTLIEPKAKYSNTTTML